MNQLQNKTAIVTGGASGIGEAISKKFCEEGAYVHILELNMDMANALVTELQEKGFRARAHLCDVTKQAQVKEVVDQIAEEAGVDILINNAGIAHIGNVENTTEAEMDRLYAVNIKGVYNCKWACVPHMKKGGGGAILNLASIASSVALSDRFAYSMTKGAVLTMTYSVAKDYIDDNIRCNCISPARVHTPFVDGYLKNTYPGREKEMYEKLSKTQPIGRMGQPHEIADFAAFLCSDKASFLTGTDYPIDGGFIKLNG